ncbi:Alpha-factor-transporting ATPase [Psilocybe cubensis]|nr:Alpha-factor-transporting ATPase [Psilocybe cubensis]KAH9478842.1 Alpha-factor-transporting ATPase [Psilocybe cubensis]
MNFDEWDMGLLDQTWLRSHVACVGQQGAAGVVIFDEKSIYENIAMALHDHPNGLPSRRQVEGACRAALLHEFVRDLPQGYDTLLGGGAGIGVSGGQKQRLAIARALLRNPAVLILGDLQTRPLPPSTLWRHNKTTIVITHDLSQITAQDFVYVLKDGRVVEQGYRSDLEEVKADYGSDQGEFKKLMDAQRETGGFLPEKDDEEKPVPALDLQEEADENKDKDTPQYLKHQSLTLRPMTFGAWMFYVLDDLIGTKPAIAASATVHPSNETQESLENQPRRGCGGTRIQFAEEDDGEEYQDVESEEPLPPFWALMRIAYRSISRKLLLFFGLVVCVMNGAMTPIFSYLLSRLLYVVSIGAQDLNAINTYGGLVLGAAGMEGFLLGVKYFVMETVGISWATSLRKRTCRKIMSQDRAWFDLSKHSPARLVQILIKDGDDARDLIAVVWGQMVVVVAMLSVGLVWALVAGWQLTLAGMAIAPIFAGVMAIQTKLVGRCEVRNKRAREEVARGYYDVSNDYSHPDSVLSTKQTVDYNAM